MTSPSETSQTHQTAWQATVLTLFPEMFPGPLGVSLVGQALEAGLWSLDTIQLRDFGLGKHRTVDDTPAGGGAGMVMRPDVLAAAIDHATDQFPAVPILYMSPRGAPFTQETARELARGPGMIILAGRFEGIDERVIEARGVREVSIGDFVLSGGELAAMALIDACVRLQPGVLGAAESLAQESFENSRLEYPQYTKPRTWEGRGIPDVLLSGNHQKIDSWRKDQSEKITRERRPDLLRKKDDG